MPINRKVVVPSTSDPGTAFSLADQQFQLGNLNGQYGVMGAQFTLSRGTFQSTAGSGDPANYYPGTVSSSDGISSYDSGGGTILSVDATSGVVTINTGSNGNTQAVELSADGLQVICGTGNDALVGAPEPWRLDWIIPGTQTVIGTIGSYYDITSVNPPEDNLVIGLQLSTTGRQGVVSHICVDTEGVQQASSWIAYNEVSKFSSFGIQCGPVSTAIYGSDNIFRFTNINATGSSYFAAVYSANPAQSGGSGPNAGVVPGIVYAFSNTSSNPSSVTVGCYANVGAYPTFPSNSFPTIRTSYSSLFFSVGGSGSASMNSSGVITSTSTRAQKINFRDIDRDEILNLILATPVQEWEFKSEVGVRRIGPTAEDFYRHFRLGAYRPSKEHRTRPQHEPMIASADVAGVALLGTQALTRRVKELELMVKDLDHRLFLQEVG